LGKVESFNLDGLDLFFNSHDHWPPHFHVRKPGQWEIRVFFLLCNQENGLNFQVKWPANAKISSKEKKQILDHVLANRSKLLSEWEAKVCTQGN
jgi:hypothetical protein